MIFRMLPPFLQSLAHVSCLKLSLEGVRVLGYILCYQISIETSSSWLKKCLLLNSPGNSRWKWWYLVESRFSKGETFVL